MITAKPPMCKDDTPLESDPLNDDELLRDYRAGEEAAARALCERYYKRLVSLARKQMGGTLREVEEPRDVVQSVFESVFRRASDFELGPNGLWPLLAAILLCKIRSHIRFWKQECRDRSREMSLENMDPLECGPSPKDVTELNDLIDKLIEGFSSSHRQEIIRNLLQGFSAEEIACRLGVSKTTVYRTRQTLTIILKENLAAS